MRTNGDPPPRPHPVALQRLRQADDEFATGNPAARRDPRALAALQASAGNRAVAQLFQPTLQRVTRFDDGAVHETRNLAAVVANPDIEPGTTEPMLNGNPMTFRAPPTPVVANPAGGFDASIGTIPTNVGSYDETVLSGGPWRTTMTKDQFRTLFPGVGCKGTGDTEFRARGLPGDAALQAANRRHEDHHVADIRAAFTGIIGAWDTRLTNAKAAGTTYHGDTAAAARAALWAAMGGTPTSIFNLYQVKLTMDGQLFHNTAAGGPVYQSTTKPAKTKDHCSRSRAYYRSPG